MTSPAIAQLRLYNQHLSRPTFEKPCDVVGWFGAIQAQDYLGSLWAIGLRANNLTEQDVEKAIADKTIVRTWPVRRTLHFVTAADVRWILDLATPRIVANSAGLNQQLGLDDRVFARSKALFERALEGGKQLRRDAMYRLLEAARISTAGGRGLHILCRLAMDGVICFGAREGKQPTFTLLDEWAPEAKTKERDEALAELARRYFTSHGPATLQDYVWWSGLRTAETRAGLEMAKPSLVQEVIDGQTYWLTSSMPARKDPSPTAYLLPPYDEYTVAYKDRSAVLDPLYSRLMNTGNGVFFPMIAIDGRVVGTWKRLVKKGEVIITPSPFTKISKAETRAFATAARRYGKFLGSPVVLP